MMTLLVRLLPYLLSLALSVSAGRTDVCDSGTLQSCGLLSSSRALVESLLGQVPDSIRVKIFAALAKGDVEGAVSAYMAHKGMTDAPRWLQAFQAAFNVANRELGHCPQVARDIHAALTRFGGSPEYVRVSSATGPYLTWYGRQIMSDNNTHFAVRYSGRIYDAFTGVSGMLEREYMAAIEARAPVTLVVTGAP